MTAKMVSQTLTFFQTCLLLVTIPGILASTPPPIFSGTTFMTVGTIGPTCTFYGIAMACQATPTSSPITHVPVFDKSTVSCDSSSLLGSTNAVYDNAVQQACANTWTFGGSGDENPPLLMDVKAQDGNTITFEVDFDLTGMRLGSTFDLTPEACQAAFTYARDHCEDKDGGLYLGGLVSGTYEGFTLGFMVYVDDAAIRKRGGVALHD